MADPVLLNTSNLKPMFKVAEEEDSNTNNNINNINTISNSNLNTSTLKPMFKITEEEEVDDSRWETDPTTNINLNPINLSGQTSSALGKIPTSTPMIAEEIDSRIQIKFEEQRDATNARIAESEYAKIVSEEHAIQLKERLAELKSRNMTVEEAREKAAMRGPDALANFESNFASPEVVGEQKRKESEEWSETARDRLVARLNSPNMITSGITDQLLDGPLTLSEINTLVMTDEFLNPATSLVEIPVHYANFQEALKEGRYWAASGNLAMIGIEAASATVVLKPINKGITATWKLAGGGKQKGYDAVQLAIKNETELYDKITAANKVIADANAEMRSDYIIEYERRINSIRKDAGEPPISISKQDETTGLFSIDTEKTREQGSMIVTDAYRTSDRTDAAGQNLDKMDLENLGMGTDNIAIPILKPEKLDALIAIATTLKKENPNSFKRSKGKTLIDNLFELTVDKDLLASDELLDMLNKHGMSYEEYILGVVGSGSEAGRLLQKLSQVGRARPKSLTDMRQNQKLATEKSIRSIFESTVIRVEGARRGILVSSWATTARNITSAAIVQPMHSIANLADAVLIAGRSKDNVSGSVLSGLYTLGSKSTWKGSFSNLIYIFKDQEYAKEMTEYILKYPELSGQYKKMFDGIGEIQTNLGRGQATTRTGKILDGSMSKIEDGVQFLNIPNRWQDHVMRRGTFVAELERRFKLEYGQDLQQLIKEGKIQEILNDTSNIRPDGAPSFLTLVEEATKKSMDLTFAGTPNNKVLENISNTIVKSGVGTMFVPFPRFVMTSLEWMGDHTTGAFQVPLRKALLKSRNADLPEKMQKDFIELSPVQFNKKYKKTKDQVRKEAGSYTTRDREQITRNLVGWAAIAGIYQLRDTEGMSSDYKRFTLKSENENGEVTTEDLDVTAQYPMRQMSWIAEYLRRSNIVGDGTLGSWAGFNFKEVLETFTGIQARTGTTNIWVEEIQNFIGGMKAEDKENTASFDKIFGRFIGQYAASAFVPMTQIVTAQRAMGIRSEEMKDHADLYAPSTNLEGQFSSNMSRSFFQNELFIAPSTINALNERETLAKENPKRIKQGMKLFFGLNYYESDPSDIDFLKEIGWTDPTYSLGSRKKEKSAKNYVNRELSKILPDMVGTAKREARLVAKKWKTNPYLQKTYKTERAAFNTVARQYIKDQFNNFKTEISKEADLEVNELALVLRKYKAMSDTSSEAALLEFRKQEKREPVWSNIDDLEDLIFYGRNIEK
tara:strand:+ start:3729 stop:7469 length:3741 start_codon:yes stop_codon:yes gene_type:complete